MNRLTHSISIAIQQPTINNLLLYRRVTVNYKIIITRYFPKNTIVVSIGKKSNKNFGSLIRLFVINNLVSSP